MADLNRDLKQYLTRSDKSGSSNGSGLLKSFSLSSFSLGSKSSSQASLLEGETSGGGWFDSNSEPESDPCLPSLSKKQRIIGFFLCFFMGIFCFTMASLFIPVLVLKARKFAVLYTMGSLFLMGSFAILWGPINHMRHICSAARLPFTSLYFGSMFATLYFALSLQNTILTVLFAVIQIISLFWYFISYLPGGQTGFKFFTKIFSSAVTSTVSRTLPV